MFTKRQLQRVVVVLATVAFCWQLSLRVGQTQRRPAQVRQVNPTFQIPGRSSLANPPVVEEVSAKILPKAVAQGNAQLRVRFAKEERLPRQFVTRLDDRPVTLRDDGQGGDDQAGDGIFSTITKLNLEELQRQQTRVRTFQTQSIPIFRGREIIGQRNLAELLVPIRPGRIIPIFPLGNPDNIDPERSLLVRDPKVVQDPSRTRTACDTSAPGGSSMGKWSFGYLMQQMANTPVTGITPEAFTLRWLKRWKTNQTVNDWSVAARPSIQAQIIDKWPKNSDGSLDLAKAPFRLLAIVNRVDSTLR